MAFSAATTSTAGSARCTAASCTPRCVATAAAASAVHRRGPSVRARPCIRARSSAPDLDVNDPAVRQRLAEMQEAMKRPEVQAEMAKMQQMMQSQALQQRMAELRNDPEFAEMFEEIAKGGMPALMKVMNDPKWLTKLGERLGDLEGMVPEGGAPGAPPAAAAAPPMPEVKDLHDAAKYGDLEGCEDLIAIGKDVNARDAEDRTPLHFACGAAHAEIAAALIGAGAELEAVDSKGNTPLMYAAGYGRPQLVALLLDKGAKTDGRNGTGKTASDLAGLDPRNPVGQDAALMARLKQ